MKEKEAVLILSSGGARGLAQIGVIEELEANGWNISAIAGSSIGALIGGFYAAGKLNAFKEWVKKLDRIDVMRYFDVTFSSRGFIKGDRIMKEMRKLMGDVNIEDLPIRYRAVSGDIVKHEPVVFDKGDLITAIHASVSIPGVFTPFQLNGALLVDGAVTNPMPMSVYELSDTEKMIAVNLNARIPYEMPENVRTKKEQEQSEKVFHQWKENVRKVFHFKKTKTTKKPGLYGVLFRSFEMMQESYTMELIQRYHPDVLVELSRESADTFEFNKAEELIAYGRQQTKKVLEHE
ncbi:NTE family protein RssA [Salinivirga cyanobacteriivorans]|uniref:NTE family protein RssA n=1 Tax=Salinivirga cyanobacteriivorans TaxID=1307839 RepID=A0A0S2HZ68_9BACT|nr:patatin-like phospholipase family protein [Salinivirga cyanobacteriivorans]ALO15316.1 NTE family protein RssA [Salinivirga cyanobacteriivorans]